MHQICWQSTNVSNFCYKAFMFFLFFYMFDLWSILKSFFLLFLYIFWDIIYKPYSIKQILNNKDYTLQLCGSDFLLITSTFVNWCSLLIFSLDLLNQIRNRKLKLELIQIKMRVCKLIPSPSFYEVNKVNLMNKWLKLLRMSWL